MDKIFLTYQQQISHLKNDKKILCTDDTDKSILCRNGYFNLINGYKTPFINGKNDAGKHQYIKNTSLSSIYALKIFDDELRILLLSYIVKAEEEIRALTAYKFDEHNNMGSIPWYSIEAYNPQKDINSLISFISKAYSEIAHSDLKYVSYFTDDNKVIPTWILTKLIIFNTFIEFLSNSKDIVKSSLCKLYSINDARGYYNYKLLLGSLHWMRKVRNACAHNERIYTLDGTTKRGTNKRIHDSYFTLLPSSYTKGDTVIRIIDLLVYLKYYLITDDYNNLITKLISLLLGLQEKVNPIAFDNIRASLGIKDIKHLELLMTNRKIIEYNKF